MNDIFKVCELFKKNKVKFAVAGARACGFHGYVRATEDIDILIQSDKENIERTIHCIEELYPHLEKITVEDFLENIVIKFLDEPELDVMLSAWSLTYDDAKDDICERVVDGLSIPYLGLKSLILSKNTSREQDIWDVKVLSEIYKKRNPNE
jgi:acylphosphatase